MNGGCCSFIPSAETGSRPQLDSSTSELKTGAIVQLQYGRVNLTLSRDCDPKRAKSMPTVLCDGPYSFLFFSSDRGEPLHIPVKRDRRVAKFWRGPVALATNREFSEPELNNLERLVRQKHINPMARSRTISRQSFDVDSPPPFHLVRRIRLRAIDGHASGSDLTR